MSQDSKTGDTRAAVLAITGAFKDAAFRWEAWRKGKGKKVRKSGESELSDSLEEGAPIVKGEYEKFRAKYGHEFERGDGE